MCISPDEHSVHGTGSGKLAVVSVMESFGMPYYTHEPILRSFQFQTMPV
jgi:hypothetical protein